MQNIKKSSLKQILAAALAIIMVFSLLPTMALAEDPEGVAAIDTQGYATLQLAINDASTGDTVRLLADVDENVTIAAGTSIILDLNGFTLNGGTVAGKAALTNNGTVTIMDFSTDKNGMIKRSDVNANGYYVILNKGTMTIASGNVYNNTGTAPNGSSLICNVGTSESNTANLTISGGKIHQDGFIAVKNDDWGVLRITGGTVSTSGDSDIATLAAVQNWHKATILNGTIGNIWASVWSSSYPDSELTIYGGIINGRIIADRTTGYDVNVDTVSPMIHIISGYFDPTLFVIENSEFINLTGGYFTIDPTDYVADGSFAVKTETEFNGKTYNYTVGIQIPNPPKTVTQAEENSNEKLAEDALATCTSRPMLVPEAIEISDIAEIKIEEFKNTLEPNTDTYIHLKPTLEIGVEDYDIDSATLTLDIKPFYDIIVSTTPVPTSVNTSNSAIITERQSMSISSSVDITIGIPDSLANALNANPNDIYVKHIKSDGTVYYYEATLDGMPTRYTLSFTILNGFSTFVVQADTRTADVTFEGDAAVTTYKPDNVGDAFPVPAEKDGYTYSGWTFIDGDGVTITTSGKTLTDALLTTLSKIESAITATPYYTQPSISFPTGTPPAAECDGGENCPSAPFADVDTSKWYHKAIDYVIANKIMNGKSSTTFAPDGSLTRAMMVQILYTMENKPAAGASSFSDVADDAWYADAVAWTEANKIVSGYTDGTFKPDNKITREQMALILSNYCEYKNLTLTDTRTASFTDADSISDWARGAVDAMYAAEILNGKSGNTFAPKSYATRAEAAQMFMNFIETTK